MFESNNFISDTNQGSAKAGRPLFSAFLRDGSFILPAKANTLEISTFIKNDNEKCFAEGLLK
jgi:hypothetical protein